MIHIHSYGIQWRISFSVDKFLSGRYILVSTSIKGCECMIFNVNVSLSSVGIIQQDTMKYIKTLFMIKVTLGTSVQRTNCRRY